MVSSIAPPNHTRRVDSTTDDWITPRWLIERLAPFDLDPCSSDYQPWPCAKLSFIRRPGNESGLALPWAGLVWLNPPYGKSTGDWLRRLASHGNGIALVFARTETSMFFRYVWPYAACLLFLHGRLTFCRPDGSEAPHNSGGPSVLIGYGSAAADRLSAASDLGALVYCRKASAQ